jgi:hypothetical protein
MAQNVSKPSASLMFDKSSISNLLQTMGAAGSTWARRLMCLTFTPLISLLSPIASTSYTLNRPLQWKVVFAESKMPLCAGAFKTLSSKHVLEDD